MKKYQIIYADPPWKYEKMNAYELRKVNVDVYDRMEIDDICKLPVNDIAEDNALLFLWVTTPFLKKGIRVMESWGFDYVTIAFVWVKTYRDGRPITGMGWYTRNSVEMVLLGKRGKRLHREDMNVHQLIQSPLRGHSRKPDEIRTRIVKLLGDVPRIELFARERVEGWDAWGNEVPNEQQNILSNSIVPPSNSASQVSKADEHNISLKDNSKELSQISSNDETSLNNNIMFNKSEGLKR